MKKLAIMFILLCSTMVLASEVDTQPFMPPQPGGGGHRPPPRWEQPGANSKEYFEAVKSILERVISYNPTVVNNYPNLLQDFKECEMMRREFIADCLREKGIAIVDAAMAAPVTQPAQCGGYVTQSTLLWDGRGGSAGNIRMNDQFVLERKEKTTFRMSSSYINGYYVRMTSGESTGVTGYIAEVYSTVNCP